MKYVYKWSKEKKKHVYEHREIMERRLHRPLETWETVHHINGNTRDNNIKNLIVLRGSEHAKKQWEERKKKWIWSRNHNKCIDCETTERPHHANGRCKNCDMKYRRRVCK